jgi:hypothetical protein
VLLFVANGELALRLVVVCGVRLQSLDGLAWEDRQAELGVGLGVLVAGLGESALSSLQVGSETYKDPSVVWKRAQGHVQRFVHLLACSLEKPAAA